MQAVINTPRIVTKIVAFVFVMGLFAALMTSCENPIGNPYPNTIPDTRLANVPTNDTIAAYIRQGAIPEQTLYWVGDDPDGFVVGFKFRWIDYQDVSVDTTRWSTVLNLTNLSGTQLDTLILVNESTPSLFRVYNFFATINPNNQALINSILDSLATGRTFAVPYLQGVIVGDSVRGANPVQIEAPTKGSFIFGSPADSNQHRFEVSSVDNNDQVDPTPAFVHFWTLQSPSLIVYWTSGPTVANSPYVLAVPTETAPGLTFNFGALDPSTNDREFSWSIDDSLHWSPWSPIPSAIVTAANFQETGSDTHQMFLRGRNRWGVVDIADTTRKFRAIRPNIDYPDWPHRTLVINNTRWNNAGGIDSSLSKAFYTEILDSLGKRDSIDMWMMRPTNSVFPSRELLANYTSVLFFADVRVQFIGSAGYRLTGGRQGLLTEYLNIGGKLIYSGTPDVRNLISPYDSWADAIFHVNTTVPFSQNNLLDFVGVQGALGYPDVALDTTKVSADSGYALRAIALNPPRGFGQTISFFKSKTSNPAFHNGPLGVRYLAGPAEPVPLARQMYSMVHFGFPLYFVRKSDAILTLKKAFEDIKESSLP